MWYETLLSKNIVPDTLIRFYIRRLLAGRLEQEKKANIESKQNDFQAFLQSMQQGPIAANTAEANEQHYEVPAAFFKYVLGDTLKYSCGYWNQETSHDELNQHLTQSEEDMLELTCQRASLVNGHHILELGCGWGSLSLYMAKKYPDSAITVVSNSSSQKAYIDEQANKRGLTNMKVLTEDMNDFMPDATYDRIISIEMFEHMRNHDLLMERLSGLLNEDGKLFIHIFCHKEQAYFFEDKDQNDWMARHFFTGGMMPSLHLPLYFARHFAIDEHWCVQGTHYQKTCEAWLQKMDQHRKEIMPIFIDVYGEAEATKWWSYWRVFFMSCAELFGYRQGNEWLVSHYLFSKR